MPFSSIIGARITTKSLLRMWKTDPARAKLDIIKYSATGNKLVRNKMNYFRADTCCINRVNHTELLEATTLMFLWHQDAVRYYIYLSDVSSLNATKVAGLSGCWSQLSPTSR